VSDLAARCPRCQAELAPAAAPAPHPAAAMPYPPRQWPPAAHYPPPYAAPERRPGPLLRAGQVLALLICLGSGFLVAQGEDSAELLGSAIGGGIAPLLLASLFLAWSRRTRPYIPFLALAFITLSAGGRAGTAREEVDRELARTRGMVNAFTDSAGPGALDGSASAPPESQRARLVWAMNQALAEVPEYKREVAARHGMDPDVPPAAWANARYMASATSHPEVGRYWQGYQAYLAEFKSGFAGWLTTRAGDHARRAGVRPGVLRGYLEGMNQGVGMARSEPLAWADSTAAAALAYHRFLVSVDARISYDPARDLAMFERNADLERATALEARVKRAADALDRAQRAAMRRSMQQVDSLAVQLR
jgi:hypothetical protein